MKTDQELSRFKASHGHILRDPTYMSAAHIQYAISLKQEKGKLTDCYVRTETDIASGNHQAIQDFIGELFQAEKFPSESERRSQLIYHFGSHYSVIDFKISPGGCDCFVVDAANGFGSGSVIDHLQQYQNQDGKPLFNHVYAATGATPSDNIQKGSESCMIFSLDHAELLSESDPYPELEKRAKQRDLSVMTPPLGISPQPGVPPFVKPTTACIDWNDLPPQYVMNTESRQAAQSYKNNNPDLMSEPVNESGESFVEYIHAHPVGDGPVGIELMTGKNYPYRAREKIDASLKSPDFVVKSDAIVDIGKAIAQQIDSDMQASSDPALSGRISVKPVASFADYQVKMAQRSQQTDRTQGAWPQEASSRSMPEKDNDVSTAEQVTTALSRLEKIIPEAEYPTNSSPLIIHDIIDALSGDVDIARLEEQVELLKVAHVVDRELCLPKEGEEALLKEICARSKVIITDALPSLRSEAPSVKAEQPPNSSFKPQ